MHHLFLPARAGGHAGVHVLSDVTGNDAMSPAVQFMTLRTGDWCLVAGVWLRCAAVAAVFFIAAGCASPAPAPRPVSDPLEVEKVEREAAENETAIPALQAEIDALKQRRARLELRQQAREGGEVHLVYDGASGKLALYKGSRQLLLAKAEIRPAVKAKSSAPAQEPPPAPGRYLIRTVQTLTPAVPLPKIKGRRATAGGNARIVFGDETHDLGFITAAASPNRPPAPKLPRWNIPVSALDSLVAAVKPETALFVEE